MDYTKLKKYGKMAGCTLAIGAMAFGLTGCTNTIKASDLTVDSQNPAVLKLIEDAKALDNDAVKAAAVSAAVPEGSVVVSAEEQKVLADAKAAAEEVAAAQAAAEKELAFEKNGKVFTIALGAPVGEAVLDHTDMALVESELTFQGEKYDYHEEVVISPDVKVLVNTVPGADKAFVEPHVIFDDEGAMSYTVSLDEELEDEISVEHPLDLPFLNGKLSIVDWDGLSIKVANGLEYNVEMANGNTVEFDGKTFKLDVFADGKVRVTVDGVGTSVHEGDSADIGDYSVFVKEVCYDEREAGHDIVSLRIAKTDALKVIENGDEYEPDEDFEWVITESSVGLKYVGEFDEKDEGALAVGESFDFLGKFKLVNVGFDEKVEYAKFIFSPKEIEDEATLRLQASKSNSIELDGHEYEEVFITPTGTWFKNDDNDYEKVDMLPTLVNGDLSHAVTWTPAIAGVEGVPGTPAVAGYWSGWPPVWHPAVPAVPAVEEIEAVPSVVHIGDLAIEVSYDAENNEFFLGEEAEESEANEVSIAGFSVSDKDTEDWMSTDGWKVRVEEDSDKVTFEMPDEEVEQKIVVGSQ